ncbi:hypothetical protein JTE90_008555, partial [Oedothorax gibbosus]
NRFVEVIPWLISGRLYSPEPRGQGPAERTVFGGSARDHNRRAPRQGHARPLRRGRVYCHRRRQLPIPHW